MSEEYMDSNAPTKFFIAFYEGSVVALIESDIPLPPNEWKRRRDTAVERWNAIDNMEYDEQVAVPADEFEVYAKNSEQAMMCYLFPGLKLVPFMSGEVSPALYALDTDDE